MDPLATTVLYNRIKVVDSFDALVSTPFGPQVNAICWRRTLDADFDALAARFEGEEDIVSLDEALLESLQTRAADLLLADLRLLRAHGLSPSLECVPRYDRDDDVVPTDVYSFHADRAPVPTDTYLCSYNEAATEGLRNDRALRRIDMPDIRAELRRRCADEDFDAYLRENCYDLHYAALDDAAIFPFGIGNMWRIAVEYPGCPVPPCLHRAPETVPGRPPRLLLIS